MGILSFIAEQNALKQAKEQAALQRQAELAQIAARGESQKAVLQKAADLEKQRVLDEAFRQWQSSAMEGIKRRSDLGTLLFNQDPTMQRGEELPAAAAMERNIMLQPEIVKATSAMNKNAFNTGLLPYQQGIGNITGQAAQEEATATRNDAYNRAMTATARKASMPQVASAQDEEAIANAKKGTLAATSAMGGLPGLIASEQAAQGAQNELARQQAGFNTKVTLGRNPDIAANAMNQEAAAQGAKSGLEINSGGMFTPGVGNQAIGNYNVPPGILQFLQGLMTSSMTNRNNAPLSVPTPTNPTQLTPRKPVFLPQGMNLPME